MGFTEKHKVQKLLNNVQSNVNILNTTTDIKKFFTSVEIILDSFEKIISYENIVDFTPPGPRHELYTFQKVLSNAEVDLIKRMFHKKYRNKIDLLHQDIQRYRLYFEEDALEQINVFLEHHDKSELALQIFNACNVGGSMTKNVKKIIDKCNSRIDILLTAINYVYPPKTNKELYIVAYCYAYAGAGYRKQTIEYMNQYIKAGGIWYGTPNGRIEYNGHIVNQLNANKAENYYYLGKAYEGEYLFDNALISYQNAYNLEPYSSAFAVAISKIYTKMNLLDKGIQFLEKQQTSIYYNSNDYKTVIDRELLELRNKKARGYIYRPHKS